MKAILWYFFLYSFLGWCSEVLFAAVKSGSFVNRGFLLGPVCPIYGLGVTFVLFLLLPLQDNLLILFVGSVIITSALEYLVGWLAEVLLHERLWDYSTMPGNLKGYICPAFSLMWGIACVLVVRVIHPLLVTLVSWIPSLMSTLLLCLFSAVFLADLVLTAVAAVKLPRQMKAAEELEQLIRGVSDTIGERLYIRVARTEAVSQQLDIQLAQFKALIGTNGTYHRWEKAFPHLTKQAHHRRLETIRAYVEALRNKEGQE